VFRVRGWPGRARANADRRAPVLYVALGDSTVEGVGATTPRLVTLSIGPNDITAHVPVGDYERDVDTIFRRLTRETDAVVVANLLPDLAVTPRFRGRETTLEIGALTAPFNEALLRRARAYGIEVVDLYRPSQAEIPQRPELVASDGYQPSDVGYERWAEIVWAGVARHIAAR
jgi:lysophospholipase L1-like esterase